MNGRYTYLTDQRNDVEKAKGELVGCIIAPGIKTSLESLVTGTAQLPMIELVAPKSVLAKNTETAMQAGIVFGMAGLPQDQKGNGLEGNESRCHGRHG